MTEQPKKKMRFMIAKYPDYKVIFNTEKPQEIEITLVKIAQDGAEEVVDTKTLVVK